MAQTVDPFDWPDGEPQNQYPTMSVTLGELVDGGMIDINDPAWHWDAYDDDQYKRVWRKIQQHYWRREIGVLPPGDWHREFMRKMNEIMPKYKPFYKALADGTNILATAEVYGKNRSVNSDFPATQLKPGVNDYASNAADYQHDTITQGDWMEKARQVQSYDDVDLMIVNEIGSLFTSILTPGVSFM